MAVDHRPVVSILVPAYNHGPYIAQCLESILSQDFDSALEVLVGEDCSTDGTRHVVEDVAAHDSRISVITSPTNVGMHANFRRLLELATGDFVAFCEGDDYWHDPRKLRLQVAELAAKPGLSGVHSDVDHLVFDGHGWIRTRALWASLAPDRGPLTTTGSLLRQNTIQTCSVMVRRAAVRGYPLSRLAFAMYAVEDWPMFLHVSESGPFGVMPESLATYRSVAGSMTNQGFQSAHHRIEDQFRLLHDASALYPGHECDVEAGLRRTRNALVLNAIRSGRAPLLHVALEAGRRAGIPQPLRLRLLSKVARWSPPLAIVAATERRWHQFRSTPGVVPRVESQGEGR